MSASRRRWIVPGAIALTATLALASILAYAKWSSGGSTPVAIHPKSTTQATPSPPAEFAISPESPTATTTATASPDLSAGATASSSGLPLPDTSAPNANQAILGTDGAGRPLLASVEQEPGAVMQLMTTTWKWDGSHWQAIRSDPSMGAGGNIAYDPLTQQVIALTGGYMGIPFRMFAWDGASWTEEYPATMPTPGTEAELVYDPGTRQFIALAGDTSVSATWIYDGSTWTRVTSTVNPPARHAAGLAYDPVHARLVLFGGQCITACQLDDTWTWDGKSWTQQHPATTPDGGTSQLAYDSATGQLILLCERRSSTSATDVTVSTWTWDGSNWSRLQASVLPPPAWNVLMTYDRANQTMVSFGNTVSSSTRNGETWVYTGTTWRRAN